MNQEKVHRIFFPDSISQENMTSGLGTIFLASKNINNWHDKFYNAIVKSYIKTTIISNKYLTINHSEKYYEWDRTHMLLSQVVCFWFDKPEDVQSMVQFGSYLKTDGIFYGRNPESKNSFDYLDWIFWKEHNLYPAESVEELADMVIHWMKE
jgi:hypothetical protein